MPSFSTYQHRHSTASPLLDRRTTTAAILRHASLGCTTGAHFYSNTFFFLKQVWVFMKAQVHEEGQRFRQSVARREALCTRSGAPSPKASFRRSPENKLQLHRATVVPGVKILMVPPRGPYRCLPRLKNSPPKCIKRKSQIVAGPAQLLPPPLRGRGDSASSSRRFISSSSRCRRCCCWG